VVTYRGAIQSSTTRHRHVWQLAVVLAAGHAELVDSKNGRCLWDLRSLRGQPIAACCSPDTACANRYEDDAWEVLLGYDQEKSMGERAGAALVEDLKTVDRQGGTPADDV